MMVNSIDRIEVAAKNLRILKIAQPGKISP